MIDTHVHFDGLGDADAIDAAIKRAAEVGVDRMLAVGGDTARNAFMVNVAAKYSFIKAAVGYDRDCAEAENSLTDLELLIEGNENIVSIGEIGLDLHYHPESELVQRELFCEMLALARRRMLPIVVHSRNADEATLEDLKEHVAEWGGNTDRIGVLHCFTGNLDFMKKLLDLGLYISFSGIVTFKNADALRDTVHYVPDDRLLIETDTPYLAPIPHRGKTNEPSYVVEVAKTLAMLRATTVENIAEITTCNAERLFGL
ncbi:MAG: TatD family hydrolase, partial [Kiritimatiellae bacterium]|nr:TatD family hydrolase [Kiritimatiellia bacterium]